MCASLQQGWESKSVARGGSRGLIVSPKIFKVKQKIREKTKRKEGQNERKGKVRTEENSVIMLLC